jgi:hypothetical protein
MIGLRQIVNGIEQKLLDQMEFQHRLASKTYSDSVGKIVWAKQMGLKIKQLSKYIDNYFSG